MIKISPDFLPKKPYVTSIHAITCQFLYVQDFMIYEKKPLGHSCQTASLRQHKGQQRPCV